MYFLATLCFQLLQSILKECCEYDGCQDCVDRRDLLFHHLRAVNGPARLHTNREMCKHFFAVWSNVLSEIPEIVTSHIAITTGYNAFLLSYWLCKQWPNRFECVGYQLKQLMAPNLAMTPEVIDSFGWHLQVSENYKAMHLSAYRPYNARVKESFQSPKDFASIFPPDHQFGRMSSVTIPP